MTATRFPRPGMTDAQVLAWLREEYAQPLVGWDFSYLAGWNHKPCLLSNQFRRQGHRPVYHL